MSGQPHSHNQCQKTCVGRRNQCRCWGGRRECSSRGRRSRGRREDNSGSSSSWAPKSVVTPYPPHSGPSCGVSLFHVDLRAAVRRVVVPCLLADDRAAVLARRRPERRSPWWRILLCRSPSCGVSLHVDLRAAVRRVLVPCLLADDRAVVRHPLVSSFLLARTSLHASSPANGIRARRSQWSFLRAFQWTLRLAADSWTSQRRRLLVSLATGLRRSSRNENDTVDDTIAQLTFAPGIAVATHRAAEGRPLCLLCFFCSAIFHFERHERQLKNFADLKKAWWKQHILPQACGETKRQIQRRCSLRGFKSCVL